MARTRLRQLSAIRNSTTYTDTLNSGNFAGASAEGQPGDTIGTADGYTASIDSSLSKIIVDGNYVIAGANSLDRVTLTGGTNDGVIAIIDSLSYSAGLDQTTFIVTTINTSPILITDNSPVSLATVTVDPNKSVQRDLDFIRTQLKKLNQKPHWYSDPTSAQIPYYQTQTGTDIASGTPVVLTNSFNAGEPYTLKVYLNGVLLLPSLITAGSVTTQNDYQEKTSSAFVGVGQTGDRVVFNFDLKAVDIVQFKWIF